MATLKSLGNQARPLNPNRAGEVLAVEASYEASSALADNDVIELFWLPAGCKPVDLILFTDELDTDASPTLTVNVGTESDEDAFIDGATTGDAENIQRPNVSTFYDYSIDETSNTKVVATIDGAPTAGGTGTLRAIMTYRPISSTE